MSRNINRLSDCDISSESMRLPFRKILVANRGEIALRIILACKELGIQTVAIYSEADRNSLHVRFADQDICIGPAPSLKSYLNIPQIMAVAEITGAEAIHPGYGFLSENPHFVDICRACGINFIGPNANIMRTMGDKAIARATMRAAGVPTIPGSDGVVNTLEEAISHGKIIGYPVIVKASFGGGGRGMRIVNNQEEMSTMYRLARNEANVSFSSDAVYIEKYLSAPRHIEVQILGDQYGNIITLGERECSIQRRQQKIIEESPSIALKPELRASILAMAIKAAQAVSYVSAGTVEFLVDNDDNFFFMEMNTRIQVEHPVTELVSGLDIVKEQIMVASGHKLSVTQNDVLLRGHAIECRINAEDPIRCIPSPGLITAFNLPGGPGIRIDTAIYQDAIIPPYYDSMIAKIIAHGSNRKEALARMRRALDLMIIEGVKTNIALHKLIINHADFISGSYSTNWLESYLMNIKYEKGLS